MLSLLLVVVFQFISVDAMCVERSTDVYYCSNDKVALKVRLASPAATIFDCRGKLFDAAIISNISLKNEIQIKIERCELESLTVQAVVKALGAADAYQVTLRNVNVTREHFADLSPSTLDIMNSKYVSKDALQNLPALRKLILKSSTIQLDENSFNGTENLQELEIWYINMTETSSAAFRNLYKLTDLKLLYNNIKKLTVNDFTGLINLRTLYVSNPIISIENGTFKQLPYLETITLRHEKYSDGLTLAPGAFAQMDYLKNLRLIRCDISELPENLLEDSNGLESLWVTGNLIKNIPLKLLSSKRKLQDLQLSYNRIDNLHPDVFVSLESLVKLYLDHNLITEVPANIFASLKNIKKISLEHNQIQDLSERAFSDTAALEELNLKNNKLKTLSTYLPHLQKLQLRGNQFNRVPANWIKDFPSVNEVDLSQNTFVEILANETNILPLNAIIDLSNNDITAVQQRANTAIPSYVLNNNPLKCDCRMYYYINYVKNMSLDDSATCVDGVKLTDVDLSLVSCEFSCPRNCSCTLKPFTKKFDINCKTMPSFGDFADMNRLKIEHYDLAVTSLTLGTAPLDVTPPEVKILNLTNLELTTLPKLSPHLLELDLSNNNLKEIPTDLLTDKGPKLNLGFNPFICDCEHENDLKKLMASNKTVALHNIFCENTPLTIFDVSSSCKSKVQTGLAVFFGFFALTIIIVGFYIYKNFKTIKPQLANTLSHFTASEHAALVVSAYCDMPYLTREFLPLFENEKQIKLCVFKRDFNFNDKFTVGIDKMVSESRKVIIILSALALQSKGEVKEFEMVLEVASQKNKPVLLLLLDDVSRECLSKPLEEVYQNKSSAYKNNPEGLKKLCKLIKVWNIHTCVTSHAMV